MSLVLVALVALGVPSTSVATRSGGIDRTDCVDSLVVTPAPAADPAPPSFLAALPAGTSGELGLNEVTVSQGGQDLEVQVLERIDPRRLRIMLVVDTTSASLTTRRAGMLVAAGVVANLPRGARVGVIDAARPGGVVHRLSRRHGEVAAAIRGLGNAPSSRNRRLLDAIGTAGSVIGEGTRRFRAIIVISGGSDRASTFRPGDVRRQLSRGQTAVTMVDVGRSPSFPKRVKNHPTCAVEGDDLGAAWGLGRALGARFGGWVRFVVLDAQRARPITAEFQRAAGEPIRATEVRPVPPLPERAVVSSGRADGGGGMPAGVVALPGVLALLLLSLGYLIMSAGRTRPVPQELEPDSPQRASRGGLPPLVPGRRSGGRPARAAGAAGRGDGAIDLRFRGGTYVSLVKTDTTRVAGNRAEAGGRADDARSPVQVAVRAASRPATGPVLKRVGHGGSVLTADTDEEGRVTATPRPREGPPRSDRDDRAGHAHGARSVRAVVAASAALQEDAAVAASVLAAGTAAKTLRWAGLGAGAVAMLLRLPVALSPPPTFVVGMVLVLIALVWIRHATTPPFRLLSAARPGGLVDLDDRLTAAERRALRLAAVDETAVPAALDHVAAVRREYVRLQLSTYGNPVRAGLVPVLLLLLPGIALILNAR